MSNEQTQLAPWYIFLQRGERLRLLNQDTGEHFPAKVLKVRVTPDSTGEPGIFLGFSMRSGGVWPILEMVGRFSLDFPHQLLWCKRLGIAQQPQLPNFIVLQKEPDRG